MLMLPRALVASALGVAPDTLPPGDLPLTRLAERWLGWLGAAEGAEAPEALPDYWTDVLFARLPEVAPDLCLDAVLAVLARCATADQVAHLAAGPLEDLLHRSGGAVIDRIEAEAPGNPRLRLALSGVAPEGSAGTPLWGRVQAARGGDAGLDDGAPLP